MKKILSLIATGIFLFVAATTTSAQEWKKTDPKMNHILADTTFLRATEAIIEPGEKSKQHTHPAAFFYALTDCKLRVYYNDGKTEDLDLKAGDSGCAGPERPHMTENTGNKQARFLLVELKEHPYKGASKK